MAGSRATHSSALQYAREMTEFYAMAGKKILVADDSTTMQKVLKLALSNEGYEIQTVSDGNEAIQQIAFFRPDVVLIDVSLPGKTAFEVKQAVNEKNVFEGAKFVLMSSAFEKVDEAQVASSNFHARLIRPFDPAQLRQLLASLTGGTAKAAGEKTGQIKRPAPPPKPLEPPGVQYTPPPEPNEISLAPPMPPPPVSAPHFAAPPMPPAPEPIDLGKLWDEPVPEPGPPPPMEERTSIDARTLSGFIPMPEISGVTPAVSAPQTPFTPPPQETPRRDFDDIRHLTESTIRLSGLDELSWSIDESAAKSAPHSRAPIPPPVQQPVQTPKRSVPSSAPSMMDSPIQGLPPFENAGDLSEHDMPDAAPEPTPAPPLVAESRISGTSEVLPISNHQLESLLRAQVQETVERMARQMMPDVAERIIRTEIQRLMNEI